MATEAWIAGYNAGCIKDIDVYNEYDFGTQEFYDFQAGLEYAFAEQDRAISA